MAENMDELNNMEIIDDNEMETVSGGRSRRRMDDGPKDITRICNSCGAKINVTEFVAFEGLCYKCYEKKLKNDMAKLNSLIICRPFRLGKAFC